MAVYRPTTRRSYCRGCEKNIPTKSEKVIIFTCYKGKGTNVILCDKCLETIVQIRARDGEDNETFEID